MQIASGAAAASLLSLSEVPLATLWGSLGLGQLPHLAQGLGMLLLMFAIGALSLSREKVRYEELETAAEPVEGSSSQPATCAIGVRDTELDEERDMLEVPSPQDNGVSTSHFTEPN